MSRSFRVESPVSILSIVDQSMKTELLVLVARKNTSMKQEIYEAIQTHLSQEENQKILKGRLDEQRAS
jgi:hypothetical protein